MAVPIKSLATNAAQVLTDIESKTNQNSPALPVAYNRVVSNAVAAMVLTGQLHNIDQRKECFPQTASENIGLPLWADLTGRQRGLGDQANLQADATGVNGTVIGTGSTGPTWKGSNGLFYDVVTGGTITAGVASIEILCRDSGEEGTLNVGQELKLTSTIPGIDSVLTVTAINSPGTEPESIDSWRAAIVQIAAFPPQIGTAAWFFEQALTVPGITRAYPYCDELFPGRVEIFAVADGNTDGLPTPAQLSDIEDVFTEASKDILWATGELPNTQKRIEAFESVADIYNVIITEGLPALSASLKLSVEAAITNYFLTRNPYIEGLFLVDAGVVEKTAIIAVAQNAIDAEVGETGRIADITLQKQGSLAADLYTLDPGSRAIENISYT